MSQYDLRDGDTVQKRAGKLTKPMKGKTARAQEIADRLAAKSSHPLFILRQDGRIFIETDWSGMCLMGSNTRTEGGNVKKGNIARHDPIKTWWANDVFEHPTGYAAMLLEAVKLGADKKWLAQWDNFLNFKEAWPEMAKIILATEPDPKPKKLRKPRPSHRA